MGAIEHFNLLLVAIPAEMTVRPVRLNHDGVWECSTQCESLWAWHFCTHASLSSVRGDDSPRPQALVLLLLL